MSEYVTSSVGEIYSSSVAGTVITIHRSESISIQSTNVKTQLSWHLDDSLDEMGTGTRRWCYHRSCRDSRTSYATIEIAQLST